MYRAHLIAGASLQTLPSPSFNFGAGDFTLMAMVESRQGGTVVARKGSAAGPGNGGFLLVVNPDSSVKFMTSDGVNYFQVLTGPTGILDGDCHTVAGIRNGALLSILIDGLVVATTPSGDGTSPLNVNNNLPLTIGRTQQTQEPNNQFIGDVMNVSVWNTALSGDLIVKSAFARITGSEPGLQGYWTLDATTNDLSTNANPANIVGIVTFEYCLDCVWAQASNSYAFCKIANMPDAHTPAMTVTLSREVSVAAGAPALAMAIMAAQDVPAFPAGAQVTLSDPSGQIYNQNQNTDTVFAGLSGGQLWVLMVINPAAGIWRIAVTAPAATAFTLNMQTVPSASVVQTSRQALDPLFGAAPYQARAISASGFWDFVVDVAVGAVVGVVVGAVIVATGGTALVAVAGGVGAFAVVEGTIAATAVPDIDSGSLHNATGQIAGMAGFIVSPDKFLILDANVDADEATQRIYRQRRSKLYPQVVASSFNKVQSLLLGSDMSRAKVKAALTAFSSGYVTGCGHGKPTYLTGWYVSGTSGALEEVLATYGPAKFADAEVQGKIIHFFACNCGYAGTSTSPGLGRAAVTAGAVAFFGYNVEFIIDIAETPAFCAGDIKIDLAMIAGETCDVAYTQSIAVYNSNIATLRANGNMAAAATLERNRDALVSPSTDPMYGNKNAKLKV
jgi:hypothetical protein